MPSLSVTRLAADVSCAVWLPSMLHATVTPASGLPWASVTRACACALLWLSATTWSLIMLRLRPAGCGALKVEVVVACSPSALMRTVTGPAVWLVNATVALPDSSVTDEGSISVALPVTDQATFTPARALPSLPVSRARARFWLTPSAGLLSFSIVSVSAAWL